MRTDTFELRGADVPVDDDRETLRLRPARPGLVTLAAAVVTYLLGWTVVRTMDPNPLLTQGVGVPVTIGVLGALVLSALAWRVRRGWVVGVAAGSYAGWAATTVLAALNGTPFGYGGLQADAGRMAALVTHFSTTWHNTDAADPTQPAEYPPLYPMVLGRIAAITGKPGWRLLGEAQVLLIGLSVVVGFLLWRRLVHPVTALMIAVSYPLSLATPSKANEALALVVLVPWLLATFCPPPGRPRMNPVLSGVIAGLIVAWFPSHLMVGFLGVIALAWYGWWRSAERRRYLIGAAITAGVGLVVASWYIVPLVVAYGSGHAQVVADEYRAAGLVTDPLQLVDAGTDVFGLVRLAGVIGAVLLLRRAWWAPPLTLLLLGTQLLRALVFLRFASTGHAFVLFYGGEVVSYLTLVAGLLVVARLMVWLARRVAAAGPPRLATREAIVVLLSLFVCLVGEQSWMAWAPAPRGLLDQRVSPGAPTADTQLNLAAVAHSERLPDGKPVRFPTPSLTAPLDDMRVVRTVRATLGAHADPLVLSFDQRLFAYQAWRNWLPPDRTSSSALVQWDNRYAELRRLAAITDPQRFAAATAATSRGRIDVFYLRAEYNLRAIGVSFPRSVFRDPQFVVTPFSDGTELVVRRPPGRP